MPVLTSGDMATFRGLVETLAFHDTYTLQRDTNTPDDAGGWTAAEDVAESGPCDVTTGVARPDERAVAARVQATAVYVISLPYDTIATASDRILVAGRTFEIIDVLRDGFLGTDARAICEERL